MTSKRERWTIDKIANRASKNISSLDLKLHEEVIRKLSDLENNPFDNVRKAEGKRNIYRGRIGDYRFYFRVDFQLKLIDIVLFDHKSNIKRKTIQRL